MQVRLAGLELGLSPASSRAIIGEEGIVPPCCFACQSLLMPSLDTTPVQTNLWHLSKSEVRLIRLGQVLLPFLAS